MLGIQLKVLWKMGDMFQLSVELYDTKDKKVIWSDRWQEKWDNLPMIKVSLSDGLLKALNTKPKEVPKLETTNIEAYELYLKAKHIYQKRKNIDDTQKVREYLYKAIDLDDNLICIKALLGTTFTETGDYNQAMKIYKSVIKKRNDLKNQSEISNILNGIGIIHFRKAHYEKSLKYFLKSLKINELLGDKYNTGKNYNALGSVFKSKGDYKTALKYYKKSFSIDKELGDKQSMGISVGNIGALYFSIGDYKNALDFQKKAIQIKEDLVDKNVGRFLRIGNVYMMQGDYDKSLEFYHKSLSIQKDLSDNYFSSINLSNIGIYILVKENIF